MTASPRTASPLTASRTARTVQWIVVALVLWVATVGAFAGAGKTQSRPAEQPTPTEEPWVEGKKGLKIRDLVVGTGSEAKRGKRASVRYAGWLEDGTLFDTNRSKDLLVFEVGAGRVVKGWDLGVVGMKVGGTRQLLIPAKLAYGKRGVPGRIPPDAALLFEISLRGAS